MKKIVLSFVIILSFITVSSQSKDELAVRAVLETQRQAWNAGNINHFMDGYWQSDSLMFIGAKRVTYGWTNSLNNYKKNYPDTVAMGKLDFDIQEAKKLSEMYFFVVGKWRLTISKGNESGYFSLLFKKIKNKWVIVVDHTP